jgi:hypothetical protein
MKNSNNTAIFWGAGATRELGMRTTPQQGKFIQQIVGTLGPRAPLKKRVSNALGAAMPSKLSDAFVSLITILGDKPGNDKSIHFIDADQRRHMRKNFPGTPSNLKIDDRIMALRLVYDWPALKAAVHICPAFDQPENFEINDLFNLLDMHTQSGHGFRNEESEILEPRRLAGARAALQLILNTLFYVDYQTCIQKNRKKLEQYYEFALALGRRMQNQGKILLKKNPPDTENFYFGDVHFVSLNYDPIGVWTQYIANRNLNDAAKSRRGLNKRLQLYHDHGHFIPSRRIKLQDKENTSWYPMNESVAQRLNELNNSTQQLVRLTKYLLPHGCVNWRECPDCGKLSAYNGNEWAWHSKSLMLPPPLMEFVSPRQFKAGSKPEQRAWKEKGRVDVRSCLHCGTLTSASHTQTIMQSSFKDRPPSFIEEIQRDLRVTVMTSKHIILMGYSLPPDSNPTSINGNVVPVKCTIIGKDDKYRGWYDPNELKDETLAKNREFASAKTVTAARDIFGSDNIRYFGGGCPDVFLEGGEISEAKLNYLLEWQTK